MQINYKDLSSTAIYHLMTQSIVPRPIAWILTENEGTDADNRYNLAPFSYFNAVASAPPTVMVSIGTQPDGSIKDTLANIERTENLVIHIASASHTDALNKSSATLGYGDSELVHSSLSTCAIEGFPLPLLTDAKIALACTLDHIHSLKQSTQALFFAQIQTAFYDDEIVTKDAKGRLKIDTPALNPLARLGGNEYAYLGEYLNRPRPK
jgi:flavin reductase (DIM6/NTAB) family NADH-FMN oxidoreductase RutF